MCEGGTSRIFSSYITYIESIATPNETHSNEMLELSKLYAKALPNVQMSTATS